MAGNIAGMFQQMNQAIQGQQGQGQGMLNMASQGLGNVAAAGVNAMQGPESQAPQAQGMDFMNQAAKEMETQSMIASLDLTTVEGLEAAAQAYQQSGQMAKAMALTQKAQELKDRQTSLLEKGQDEMNEASARKQALKLAMERGDRAAHAALSSGTMDPTEYLQGVQTRTDEAATAVADDARESASAKALYRAKKGIDAEYETYDSASPAGKYASDLGYKTGSDEHRTAMQDYMLRKEQVDLAGNESAQSVAMGKIQNEALNSQRAAQGRAEGAALLAGKLDASPFGGGIAQTLESGFRGFAGLRDAQETMITQAANLRNSAAIRNLPAGPASDKDIALVLKGEPPENASSAELSSYARGISKLARREAAYFKAKDRHLTRNNNLQKFGDSWELRTLKERDATISAQARQRVSADPTNMEERNMFQEYYGYDYFESERSMKELEAYLNE